MTVTVTFENAAQIKAGTTQVMYRGIEVGKVSKVSLASDDANVLVQLAIHNRQKKYLTTGTRFYLEGAAPDLSDPASLKAIIAGPTIEMRPGSGAPARSFVGISGKAPEHLAVAIPYRMIFDGPVGTLKVGAQVVLRGFNVGEVIEVGLSVDPADGNIRTAVDVALDPTRFHIERTASVGDDWTAMMNATLAALVQHKLRARLTQSQPLLGTPKIELAVVPDAPPAGLRTIGSEVQIPTVSGGDIGALLQAAGQFPLREIGNNIRAVTEHIAVLSASPQLKQSIAHMDRALMSLDKTLSEAGPKVAPTLQSIHDTVESLRRSQGISIRQSRQPEPSLAPARQRLTATCNRHCCM